MTAEEALQAIEEHLLGEDWYSFCWNHEDIYKDIVETICSRYRGKNEDQVAKWRRRHKRCAFCRHLEYLSNPCGISAYKCRAKEKLVYEWLPRPFCGLCELKIQKRSNNIEVAHN